MKRGGQRGGKLAGRGRPLSQVAAIKATLLRLAEEVEAGKVDAKRAMISAQILNITLRALSVERELREQDELARTLLRAVSQAIPRSLSALQ
jgi:hypothetical protein